MTEPDYAAIQSSAHGADVQGPELELTEPAGDVSSSSGERSVEHRLIDYIMDEPIVGSYSDEDRQQLRTTLEIAVPAKMSKLTVIDVGSNILTVGAIIFFVLMAILARSMVDLVWLKVGFSWRTIAGGLFTLPFMIAISFVWVIPIAVREYGNTEDLPPMWVKWTVFLWVAALVAAVLLGVVWLGSLFLPGGVMSLTLTATLTIAAILGLVLTINAIKVFLARNIPSAKRLDPRHELIADLAGMLAVAVHSDDSTVPTELVRSEWLDEDALMWRTSFRSRRVFARMIESAAWRVETFLPAIAPRSLQIARASLAELSAGIATSLRNYEQDVIMGGVERDRRVANGLREALLSASWGRWEELVVVEPAPRVQRFIRKHGLRLLVAALMVTAAMIVPWIFAVQLGAAAHQWRIALLVAAAVIVVDTPKAALDKVVELAKQR